MKKSILHVLMLGTSAAVPTSATIAADATNASALVDATTTTDEATDRYVETIMVVAARENRTSRGATNLSLSLMETPQSVTVLGRDVMDTFLLDQANDVLALTTGVNVEAVETDRTYYNSRGFDIKSMQVDGIGLPFNWNVVGALDTVIYDRVEVIRGANGLLTGTGNPSGTINYVRKRPTNDFQAYGEVSYGSWNTVRLEADISSPLTDDGRWAGRVIGAYESGDSHLNLYHNDRMIFSALIDGQLGNNVTLTLGYTQQDNKSDGVLWGALPMLDADGNQTDFDVSASTSMDWTMWNTYDKTAFAELIYALPAGWEAKATVTYNDYDQKSELFYTYSYPAYDSETGLGLYGWPGAYQNPSERWLVDVTLTGDLDIGGRTHELLFGANMSWSDNLYFQFDAPGDHPAWGSLPSFPGWAGTEISRPVFGGQVTQGDWTDKVRRLYGASNFHISDRLSLLLGFNYIDVKSEGYNFGETMDRDEEEISPYIGAVFKLTDNLNVYASYSDIYEPQSESDANRELLGPAVGKSYEAGLKGEWFDGRLLTSLSLFKAKQDNYADYAGAHADGTSYYQGIDLRSQGFEFEAAGHVTDWWSLQAGYTHLSLEDPAGNKARTFLPRDTFKMTTSIDVPTIPGLSLGASLRWQDAIYLETWAGTIHQDAYAVLGANVSYDINEHVTVAVNAKNLTDKKYLASLYWDQAFYGDPQSVMARIHVRY